MSYYLQAILCKQTDADLLTDNFNRAVKVTLDQGLTLIPMTHELGEQLNLPTVYNLIEGFELLTDNIEKALLNSFGQAKFAYVEAEYFGGRGGQMGVIWEHQQRIVLLQPGKDSINQVLKCFGVGAAKGTDEFSTLDFDRHRKTSQWVVT